MVAANSSTEPLLIKAPDAARILSISERKLWSLTASRQVPSVRIGKKMVRYSIEELQEWIQSKKCEPIMC
jgi:predicted DNA-binding transcriptional regulator AlpA